ncbi:MAG: sigma-54-dependent transcriptional regulator [Gemmatimonadaceae bacterium]
MTSDPVTGDRVTSERPAGERPTEVAPIRLLIAEDEEHLGAILEHFLRGRGYDVSMCRDGRTALQSLHAAPYDVALLDVVMPEMDGLEVLRHLQSEPEPPEVIIITGNGTIDTAINAINLGAYDYISKPYRMAEVDVMVRRAWEKRELVKANVMLRKRVAPLPRALTSANVAMQEMLRTLVAVAPERDAILLSGEAGSGKSYIARHVHALSGRAGDAFAEATARDGRLVTVGDLFGYEGGAAAYSSGAGSTSVGTGVGTGMGTGALVLAERGSVVVDLERLDQEAYGALCRAVSDGYFVRVGGTRRIELLARIIACVRDPTAGANFPASSRVHVAPLRQRPEDMERLTAELLSGVDGGMCTMAMDAIEPLRDYPWPGNVRELQLVLTRASLLSGSGLVTATDVRMLLASGSVSTVRVEGQGGALDQLERLHIESMLIRCNWHQGRAALALGISTKTLYRKMREYGFRRPRKRKLVPAPPEG